MMIMTESLPRSDDADLIMQQYEYADAVCVQQVVTVTHQTTMPIVHHGTRCCSLLVPCRNAKRAIYYVNGRMSAHLKHHECSRQQRCTLSGTSYVAAAAAAAAVTTTRRIDIRHVLS